MKSFEEELGNALRREAAPEGFADRVLLRARALPKPEATLGRRFGAWVRLWPFRWALAAAVCLLVVAGVVRHQRQERLRQQGELARLQVRQALRIASVKLNAARRKVLEINRTGSQSRL